MQVRTNHFPVQCSLKQAVHYDVSIVAVRRGGAQGVEGPRVQASAGPQEAGKLKPLPADTCRRHPFRLCLLLQAKVSCRVQKRVQSELYLTAAAVMQGRHPAAEPAAELALGHRL